MKKTFLFLTLITLSSIHATEFNFAQELYSANPTKLETIDLITAYQNIATQIQDHDSTRLTKKFIRLLKNLHPICYENTDDSIKTMYQNLLEVAIQNTKISAIDYRSELPGLLDLYTASPFAKASGDEPEKIEQQELEETPEAEESPFAEASGDKPEPGLAEKLNDLSRNEVIGLLYSKNILNRVERIEDKVDSMYEKVSRIEILLSQLALEQDCVRSFPIDLTSLFDTDEGTE